jgi:hypothetical protein
MVALEEQFDKLMNKPKAKQPKIDPYYMQYQPVDGKCDASSFASTHNMLGPFVTHFSSLGDSQSIVAKLPHDYRVTKDKFRDKRLKNNLT